MFDRHGDQDQHLQDAPDQSGPKYLWPLQCGKRVEGPGILERDFLPVPSAFSRSFFELPSTDGRVGNAADCKGQEEVGDAV